jgi:hypothetical protein
MPDLGASGRIALGAYNAVANPRAEVDCAGWTALSQPVPDRVTSISGVSLPTGATAAFHLGAAVSGCWGTSDWRPVRVGPGGWVWVQLYVYESGATDALLDIDVQYRDAALAEGSVSLVAGGALPTAGFVRYAGALQVPAGTVEVQAYVTISEVSAGGADDGELWFTLVALEAGVDGTCPAYADSPDTATLYTDTHRDLASTAGTIELGGSALLNRQAGISVDCELEFAAGEVRLEAAPLQVDMSVACRWQFAARRTRVTYVGQVLPPTDDDGWTIPDVTPPAIRDLVVTVGGRLIPSARISALPIRLTDRGGFDGASLTVLCGTTAEYQFAVYATGLVTYQGTEIFRGRLTETSLELSGDLAKTFEFEGFVNRLSDHEAFRRVYVDSDLDNWHTDQGPATTANIFEVQASS